MNWRRWVTDGWINSLTGLGTGRDKATSAVFSRQRRLALQTLSDLYHFDDLAATLADAIVLDAYRPGFELKSDNGDLDVGELGDIVRNFDVARHTRMAAIWGRVFGWAAVFVETADGFPEEPLPENVQLLGLSVVDAQDAAYVEATDTYIVNGQTVHPSRLIVFEGLPTSRRERRRNAYRALSVYERAWSALQDVNTAWDSVSHMFTDMSQSVLKMRGLIDTISSQNEDAIQTRVEMTDKVRSVARMLVLDAESEDFSVVSRDLAGPASLLPLVWQRLAAVGRMPVTRLMGMSPSGLNATGESDVRLWYDSVEAYRTDELDPQVTKLVRLILSPVLADPMDVYLEWGPLWQMDPTQEATLRNSVAATDVAYINAGVVEHKQSDTGQENRHGHQRPCVTHSID